jgi:hypothetical protein
MWTFADDRGVHPASSKTLKAEVFPSDDLTSDEVAGLVREMHDQSLVETFEANGKFFWHVTGWDRHQRIDRPTYKHPAPPSSTNGQPTFDEHSTSPRRAIDEHSTPEGKGKEGKGMETKCTPSGVLVPQPSLADPGQDDCPHQSIIALYHEVLPMCPPVKIWNKARRAFMRQRWRESPNRQDLDWWRRYFGYVAESPFLTGMANPAPGRLPFLADLEWLVRPGNMAKVIEGKYHHEVDA